MSSSRATPLVSPPQDWVIEPRRAGLWARLGEVWQYRKLLGYFARRSFQKVYARTKLGWLWIFIRPLFPLVVKTLVFGGVLQVASSGVPYFLFLVVGSCTWELFASAVMWATRSLELNRGLFSRIYIPRLIMPIAMVMPSVVTFGIYFGVALCAAAYFGITQGVWYLTGGLRLVWGGVAVFEAFILAVAIGLWTSVPALQARDVRFTLGYVLGFAQFLTPILYPLSAVPARWQAWVLLNPMAAVVETFKWSLLGIGELPRFALGISWVLTLGVLAGGLWFFGRAEADAADHV